MTYHNYLTLKAYQPTILYVRSPYSFTYYKHNTSIGEHNHHSHKLQLTPTPI